MPHFTLQIGAEGPVLSAIVTVSEARAAALRRAGQPIPDPVPIRALLDTGASCTCIDPIVIDALELTPTGSVRINTPTTGNRPQDRHQYDVGLAIPGPERAHTPLFVATIPVVATKLLQQQGFAALLGRDILASCLLTYNGTMGWYTLAF